MTTYVGGDPIELRSTDGRTVRVEFGPYSFTAAEAHDAATNLIRAAQYADRLPDIDQRHGTLLASCPLCVYEAGGQLDRLTYDELEDDDDVR